MKFQQVLSLLALTSTVYSQGGPIITGVVGDIDQATKDFDSAVKAFSGDPKSLQAAQAKIKSVIESGVAKVKAAPDLTITEAAGLTSQTTGLQTDVEAVVNDLISKKSALISAGQGQIVESGLKDQLAGAQALSSAITSKVPEALKSTATQLSSGIADALQKGVTAFADAPAGPSGGSSSASSGGASSAAAPAGSPSSASKPSGSSSGSAPVTTSAKVQPAVSTGAASSFKAPVAGVLALGALALAF